LFSNFSFRVRIKSSGGRRNKEVPLKIHFGDETSDGKCNYICCSITKLNIRDCMDLVYHVRDSKHKYCMSILRNFELVGAVSSKYAAFVLHVL